MSNTNPDDPIDDQAQKFVILTAIKKADGKPYPVRLNPDGGLTVEYDLPSTISPSLDIVIPDTLQHQLPDVALKAGLKLIADEDNVGTIWIGASLVGSGSDGGPLYPGESMTMAVDNAEAVYYIADNATDILYVLGG